MKYFCSLSGLVLYVTCTGQGNGITTQKGSYSFEGFAISKVTRFREFIEGTAHYTDGKVTGPIKMNCDLLNDRMVFISQNGDSIPLVDERIEFFKVGNTIFLNTTSGIIEVISGSGAIKLGANYRLQRKREEVITTVMGASPSYDATSSITARGPRELNLVVVKKVTYYISIGGRLRVLKATRGKVLKAFVNKRKEIEAYLDKEKTNFTAEADLEKLVSFLDSIIERRD